MESKFRSLPLSIIDFVGVIIPGFAWLVLIITANAMLSLSHNAATPVAAWTTMSDAVQGANGWIGGLMLAICAIVIGYVAKPKAMHLASQVPIQIVATEEGHRLPRHGPSPCAWAGFASTTGCGPSGPQPGSRHTGTPAHRPNRSPPTGAPIGWVRAAHRPTRCLLRRAGRYPMRLCLPRPCSCPASSAYSRRLPSPPPAAVLIRHPLRLRCFCPATRQELRICH